MVFINNRYHKANTNFLPWSSDAFVLQIQILVCVSGSRLCRCCGPAAVGHSAGWQRSSPLGAEGRSVTVPFIFWFSTPSMSSCVAYCSGRCFVFLLKILCFTRCNTIELFPQLFSCSRLYAVQSWIMLLSGYLNWSSLPDHTTMICCVHCAAFYSCIIDVSKVPRDLLT